MKAKQPKEIFKETIKCPHCSKSISVKKTKKKIKDAVPAEYEEKLVIEKDKQTTLKAEERPRGKVVKAGDRNIPEMTPANPVSIRAAC